MTASIEKLLHKADIGATNIARLPKGIVDPSGAERRLRLSTFPPSVPLQFFVEHFWLVEWDLGGRAPEIQRVLPYPNAHLVFELGRTAIHGVVRGAFVRTVEGTGRVLGVKFKPGGLRPFIDMPLSRLVDRTMPVDQVLGVATNDAEQRVLSQQSPAAMIAAAESMLTAVLPAPDPRVDLAGQAVSAAAAATGPVSVAALAQQVGIEERTLQRLFSNHVGVSPKWVIQRFRLQEATWHLGGREPVDLAAVACQLGFFDQAHFTRNFTQMVGKSPLEYWKSQQGEHLPE